jgi:hypothetical protein
MITKLSATCYAIRLMVRISNINTLKSTYYAYFHSIIKYGTIFWGNLSNFGKIFILDIHMSVHRNIIPNYSQQDATFLDLFIFTDALHVSGGSSTHHQEHINCTYSFRYCQPILLLAATVEEMAC